MSQIDPRTRQSGMPTGVNTVRVPQACLDLCNETSLLLKAMGFVLIYTSMRSEACYYGLPNYRGVIRVAAHRFERSEKKIIKQPTVAVITFPQGQRITSRVKFESIVAMGVGRYHLAHIDTHKLPTVYTKWDEMSDA